MSTAEIFHKGDGSYGVRIDGKVPTQEAFWKFAEAEAFAESYGPDTEIVYLADTAPDKSGDQS